MQEHRQFKPTETLTKLYTGVEKRGPKLHNTA